MHVDRRGRHAPSRPDYLLARIERVRSNLRLSGQRAANVHLRTRIIIESHLFSISRSTTVFIITVHSFLVHYNSAPVEPRRLSSACTTPTRHRSCGGESLHDSEGSARAGMSRSAGVASAGGVGGDDAASARGEEGSIPGAKSALARIGAALGVSSAPQSRLKMLQRFQALDADGNGILSSEELIDGEREKEDRRERRAGGGGAWGVVLCRGSKLSMDDRPDIRRVRDASKKFGRFTKVTMHADDIIGPKNKCRKKYSRCIIICGFIFGTFD